MTVVVIIVLVGLYAAFIGHFALNVPQEDDWSVIPLIHSAMHGHFSLTSLWSLHQENRMFVPNLIFVVSGVITHDDLRVLIAISMVLFVATFLVFLALLRNYARRPPGPVVVLVLGLLWFSFADWFNALWAFQVAWYLILLCLMSMVALLTTRSQSTVAFAVAILAAVAASFSFVHGLALWPVGLICLLWNEPRQLRQWRRREKIRVLVWIGSAAGTGVATLWGYQFKALGCNSPTGFQYSCSDSVGSFLLHRPWLLVQFVLVNIGEVVPNPRSNSLWLNGVLGAVLLTAAVFVLVQSFRHRGDGRSCLLVAVIVFGLIFDFLVALGRAQFGTTDAPSSNYTMANLLIVVALVSYFWAHGPVPRDWREGLSTGRVLVGVGLVAVLLQVVIASQAGISQASAAYARQVVDARLVVNLDRVPVQQKGCYVFYGELGYLYFSPDVYTFPGFTLARHDQLSVFTPALFRKYRAEGLPTIPPCKP